MKKVDEIRDEILKKLMPNKETAKVFAAALKNNRDYQRIFRFTGDQLEKLARVTMNNGTVIAEFQIELNTFELVVEHKTILGNWDWLIMARCTNDSAINVSAGGGTGHAYAVVDKWHKKVMDYLRS